MTTIGHLWRLQEPKFWLIPLLTQELILALTVVSVGTLVLLLNTTGAPWFIFLIILLNVMF